MMEPGSKRHNNVLDLLKRSCSFDSFFQCRQTNVKEHSGLTLKWRKSVDSMMCNKEQHSLLSDAVIKRTTSIPPSDTHEIMCEIVANNSIEKSTDMNICSEEDVLNCTFESCDIEGKGEVYVSTIIGYLEDVTGQSCEKGQLKLLQKMLNPEEKDITVNLGTFHSIMKQWIAECRQEGFSGGKIEEATSFESICILPTDKKCDTTSGHLEGYGGDVNRGNLETTELINDIECLEYTNRKLVDQNAKLQRSVEGFEEANVRLTEEIFELKSKLKRFLTVWKQALRPTSPHQPSGHPPQTHPPITHQIYMFLNPSGQFSMTNPPSLNIFGLSEETGAPGRNLYGHWENVYTPHGQSPKVVIEPGPLVLLRQHC